MVRILFGFSLAVLALTPGRSAPPDEILFAAVDSPTENAGTLFRIHSLPLQTSYITSRSGSTAGLVVCGGMSYWALNGNGVTHLYRGDGATVTLIGTVTGPEARTVHLATDNQAVFWSCRRDTSALLFQANLQNPGVSSLMALSQSEPVALEVDNGEAYWAVNGKAPSQPRASVFKVRESATPELVFTRALAQMAGMDLNDGVLWMSLNSTPDSTPMRILERKRLDSSSPETLHTSSGTAGPVAAAFGRAAWASTAPEGHIELHLADQHAITLRPVSPAQTDFQNLQLVLTPRVGVIWGAVPGGVRVCSFGREGDTYEYQQTFSGLSPAGFTTEGSHVTLALSASSDSAQSLQLRFPARNGGPVDITSLSGIVRGFGSVRWRTVVAGKSLLRQEWADGTFDTVPLPVAGSVRFASGPAMPPHFDFPVNTSPTDRGLYRVSSTTAVPVSATGHPAGVSFPSHFTVVGDTVYFRTSTAHPDHRLLARIERANPNASFLEAFPNPDHLQPFAGSLVFRLENDAGLPPRRVFLGPGGVLDEWEEESDAPDVIALGRVFSIDAERTGLIGRRPGHPDRFVPLPTPTADDPDLRLLLESDDCVTLDYRNAEGRRVLCTLSGAGPVSAQLEADAFGEAAPHGGAVFVSARSGPVETVFRLLPGHPPESIGSWSPSGRGLHSFVSVGSALYAIAPGRPGSEIVDVSQSGIPEAPGVLQDVTALRTFQGLLLAVRAGEDPGLFYRPKAGVWRTLSTETLTEPRDFLPVDGRLWFTAGTGEARGLFSLRLPLSSSPILHQVSLPGSDTMFGPNPRSLTAHQGRLFFAASQHDRRELWQLNLRLSTPVLLTAMGSPYFPVFHANPIEDGPRALEFSATSLAENLPAGAPLGQFTVPDSGGDGEITWTLTDRVPGFSLELDAQTLRLTQPLGIPAGEFLDFEISATNSQGISNLAAFHIPVLSQRDLWLAENFPEEETETGPAAPGEDADGDGLVNLLERALALDPRSGAGSARDRAPGAEWVGNGASSRLELPFQAPLGFPSDLEYAVLSSADLKSWKTEGILRAGGSGEIVWFGDPGALEMNRDFVDGVTRIRFLDAPLGDAQRRFLRLRVTRR